MNALIRNEGLMNIPVNSDIYKQPFTSQFDEERLFFVGE